MTDKKCDQNADFPPNSLSFTTKKRGLTFNPGYLHLERLKWIWTTTEKQFDVDNNKTADEQNRQNNNIDALFNFFVLSGDYSANISFQKWTII